MFRRLNYFKNRPLVGLDFASDAIRLLALQKTEAGFQIEKCIQQPLVRGALEEGKLAEWKSLKMQLRAMVSEAKLSGYSAALALPSAAVIRKQIQLPSYCKEEDLGRELERRLLEYLPGMPEKELYFDYRLCDTRDEMHQVLLVATRKSQLQPYLEVVSEAGLNIKIIDVDLYARIRAGSHYLERCLVKGHALLALLDLHGQHSTLIIFQRGEAIFHQVWQLTAAEPLFFQELKKAWQHCAATHPEWRMGMVIVSGELSTVTKVLAELEENFSLQTQALDPLQGFATASSLDLEALKKTASQFLLCCGLALRVAST